MTPTNPMYLLALPIAATLALPLLRRLGRGVTLAVHALTLLVMLGIGLSWLAHFGAAADAFTMTTGWAAPFGIALRVDYEEIILINLALLCALGGLFSLSRHAPRPSARGHVLQLMLVIGALGLIMSQDLLNLFIFLEITTLAIAALTLIEEDARALEASLKYAVMGVLAGIFLLLGIALVYKAQQTLSLESLSPVVISAALPKAAVALALGMILVGLMAKLRVFPLNGPSLDLYVGAAPGVVALVVGVALNAALFAGWKVMHLFPVGTHWLNIIATIGVLTYLIGNLMAARQTDVRRMMGHSTSAHVGLAFGLMPFVLAGQLELWVIGLIVVNHALAKVALLWLAGIHGEAELEGWRGAFARQPILRIAFIASLLAMVGLPPFAGFFGKWTALAGLSAQRHFTFIAPILVGAFFELACYLRWYRASRGEAAAVQPARPLAEIAPPLIFGALSLLLGGYLCAHVIGDLSPAALILLGGGALLLLIGRLFDEENLGLISLFFIALGGYVYFKSGAPALPADAGLWAQISAALPLYTLKGMFAIIAFLGASLVALAGVSLKPAPRAYGLITALLGAVVLLLEANDLFLFFLAWSSVTTLTYLLIGGQRAGYRYALFNGAGDLLLLAAFTVALGQGVEGIGALPDLYGGAGALTWGLLIGAGLIKLGALGVHVWIPDAYAEAPDVATPLLSGVIAKLPIFLMIIALFSLAAPGFSPEIPALTVIAWLSGLTALVMALLAALQTDAKRLLAYASVGQIAYIIMGLTLMSALGWVAALYQALHHFAFDALLFLTLAGVIMRVGARDTREMGGLARVMPLSFIAALIGALAAAGLPPLGGWTGKWLLYRALLEKGAEGAGWYGLLALMILASLATLAYLYRFIQATFLGTLPARHQHVEEAPAPLLIAQGILAVALIVVGAWPQTIINPIQRVVSGTLGQDLQLIDGISLTAGAGGFSPLLVCLIGLAVVAALVHRARGQGLAAGAKLSGALERYEGALAPLKKGWITLGWAWVARGVTLILDLAARFYTGNPQTYALYAVLLLLIFFSMMGLAR